MLLTCVGGSDISREKYNQENRLYFISESYRHSILYFKLHFTNTYTSFTWKEYSLTHLEVGLKKLKDLLQHEF